MTAVLTMHALVRVLLVVCAAAALANARDQAPEHRGPQLFLAGLFVLGLVALNIPFVRL